MSYSELTNEQRRQLIDTQQAFATWPEAERQNVIGRQKFGRIAIANTDSGATAYTDVAMDQAYRAVQELVTA